VPVPAAFRALTVTEEALLEACDVLDMAVDDAVREKSA
jgi:hypothetical protein